MIKELIKLATHLDEIGYSKEADYIDGLIQKSASSTDDRISAIVANTASRAKEFLRIGVTTRRTGGPCGFSIGWLYRWADRPYLALGGNTINCKKKLADGTEHTYTSVKEYVEAHLQKKAEQKGNVFVIYITEEELRRQFTIGMQVDPQSIAQAEQYTTTERTLAQPAPTRDTDRSVSRQSKDPRRGRDS